MRLGQLARKVAVHPSEIVEFLTKNGVVIEDGTNAKVSDADTDSVIRKYAPHLLVPETQNEPVVYEIPETETTPGTINKAAENETVASISAEEPVVGNDTAEANSTDTPELIKAAKVELKGLKVIGKIDLPEAKKNPEEVTSGSTPPPLPLAEQRKGNPKRDFPKQQSRKSNRNPVALERERLEKEAEERKLRKAEKEKERRKNFYAKRVKPSAPTKAVRLIDEQVSTLEEEPKEEPKGLLRKFLRWLTT